MKNIKSVLVCLSMLVGVGNVFAEEPTVRAPQVDVNALVVEYRLRVQAQGFISDLTLFDDMGMLGRAVALPLSVDDSKETLVPSGGEKFPDSSGPSGISATPSVQLEMSGGLDPLLDLQLKIQAVQKELEQLNHQSMKNNRKENVNKIEK